MLTTIEEIYSHPPLLDYYAKIAILGLYSFELHTLGRFTPGSDTILVVGCGAGREAFALEKLGCRVTALDCSKEMIEKANWIGSSLGSRVHFQNCSLEDYPENKKFDRIWLTIGLTNHYLEKASRVRLLNKTKRLLRPSGTIHFFPDIHKSSENSRDEFGGKQHLPRKYPYHFYPDLDSVFSEVHSAELTVFRQYPEGLLLKPKSSKP